MRSMFRPIKKIFTYIQKNASNGNMFGSTNSVNTENDEVASSSKLTPKEEEEDQEQEQQLERQPLLEHDDDDIERQIKTSIIDATKVVHVAKSKIVLPLELQLDDELADFAHEPVTLATVEDVDGDDELEEQYLELDSYPNNEIIVLTDNELNSSLASDNISEDPLAIDEFTQPQEDNEEEEEIENNGELLWLKLDTPMEAAAAAVAATTSNSGNVDDDFVDAVTPPTSSTAKVPVKAKEEELLRSDGGSDSGLGSENDRHNTTATPAETTTTTTTTETKPLRSNLKRRLEDDELSLVPDMNSSSSSASVSGCLSSAQKRAKRSINFDSVKVYYFPRQQGFNCVPTAGGCTLGMGARHIAFKTMTLAEHAAELRRAHRSQNQNQEQQQQQLRIGGSSSDDSEESEEDYLSEGSGSDADDGSNGFLQPVTPKQRRALLKAAGVRKIDASEKIDCRDIRNSREVCGCSCREFCDPETCACSQAGIKCQVDRAMFPCGCTREACGNTVGRVEFNPTRVRTHYIHTVMRLDMEQRQSQGATVASVNSSLVYSNSSGTGSSSSGVVGIISPGSAAAAAAAAPSASSTSTHCYFMQPQSNYSSGYASPAYTPETSVSYYQQQQTTTPANVSPLATSYPQLDSLDSGLFASGSNATPSYGELLTPTYHQTLGYGSAQLNSYTAYQQTTSPAGGGSASPGAYSSCAVPSVPPFGNATTTASNATQYQHANALETTVSSLNSSISSRSSNSISVTTSSNCSTGLVRLSGGASGPADFISLNSPLGSSSRLSQINDLLQHNRNATSALVAVSEGYTTTTTMRSSSSNSNSTIDSIDTPPIVEDAQRSSCMTFEELPPPLINPTPIVAVVEHNNERKLQLQLVNSTPQPRQPLDTSGNLSESLTNNM